VLLKEITEKQFKDFTYYLVCEAKFMSYKVEKVGYSPEIIRKDCNYLKNILQAAYIDELIDRNRIA
jgi:hypothetical protein